MVLEEVKNNRLNSIIKKEAHLLKNYEAYMIKTNNIFTNAKNSIFRYIISKKIKALKVEKIIIQSENI